ncbi:MAG TPA: F0F1 ATP synthase subunit epsilon [Alphaproteobacteria bacterium]|nr:F0F1 ATP synthase subunit epsilon [Alphaproteobacteria bacterium]
MAEKLRFELVSPERLLRSEEVEMVVVPGAEGNFAALPRHAPLLSQLRPGTLDVYEDREVVARYFVAGGYAQVTPERCTVLADEAMALSEIDRAAVETTLKELGEDLEDAKDDAERASVKAKIAVAEAKLKATAA